MGKYSKSKDSGKGKGKQAASEVIENVCKGKGNGGKGADGLGTCTYVKGSNFFLFAAARHVICQKQEKINEAYKKLQDGWLSNGEKVPPAEFAKFCMLEKMKRAVCGKVTSSRCYNAKKEDEDRGPILMKIDDNKDEWPVPMKFKRRKSYDN